MKFLYPSGLTRAFFYYVSKNERLKASKLVQVGFHPTLLLTLKLLAFTECVTLFEDYLTEFATEECVIPVRKQHYRIKCEAVKDGVCLNVPDEKL